MIDLSSLKTPSEKPVVLYLAYIGKPQRQRDSIATTGLSRRFCQISLKELVGSGHLKAVLNEFGVTVYRIAGRTESDEDEEELLKN